MPARRTEQMISMPRWVRYQEPKYRIWIRDYLNMKMDPIVSRWLIFSLEILRLADPSVIPKVVSNGSKPAIHFGEIHSGEWRVIYWLDLCQKKVNLRMLDGVPVSDIWPTSNRYKRKDTPHTAVATGIDTSSYPTFLQLINRAHDKTKGL